MLFIDIASIFRCIGCLVVPQVQVVDSNAFQAEESVHFIVFLVALGIRKQPGQNHLAPTVLVQVLIKGHWEDGKAISGQFRSVIRT